MKRVMCSVMDVKAVTYGQPFFVPSTGVAIRSLTDEVNRAADDNQLYRHSEDFILYELGSFDDDQADFEILAKPRQLACCSDLKASPRSGEYGVRGVPPGIVVNGGDHVSQ